MLKEGDLFEANGKKFLALGNPYVKFVQDPDAYGYGYDYGSAYRFIKAQPIEPVGQAVTIKLDGTQTKVLAQAA